MKKNFFIVFLCIFVFIFGGVVAVFSMKTYAKNSIPDNFYVKNYDSIKQTEKLFKDRKTRNLYKEYIEFVAFGTDIPKKYQATFEENMFPKVMPEKGDIVIDAGIGACYGGVACEPLKTYAEAAGKEGYVYGFEPFQDFLKYIDNTVQQNPMKNIKVYPYGLWSENATKKLCLMDVSSSLVLVYTDGPEFTDVKVVSLDSFVEENNLKKVDFIKMDIEGAEVDALHGAEKTIKKYKPKLVVALYHRPEDIFNIMLYINSLNPNYTYYLGYHPPFDYPFGWKDRRNLMLYAVDETKRK